MIPAAATVVLLRDGPGGLETYLLRRAATMAFAPRMHVFPGGRVDPRDYAQDVVLRGASTAALADRASTDVAGVRALYACAVRETTEETGIALVEPSPAGTLEIDTGRLPIMTHWVTPAGESRRYDVRFFAAFVADGRARLTTTEADRAGWHRPAAALAAFAAGNLAMLPPTEAVLRQLAGFTDAAGALADAARRPVVPLLPQRRADGSAWDLVDARDGTVVEANVRGPHTRETDGRPTGEGRP